MGGLDVDDTYSVGEDPIVRSADSWRGKDADTQADLNQSQDRIPVWPRALHPWMSSMLAHSSSSSVRRRPEIGGPWLHRWLQAEREERA